MKILKCCLVMFFLIGGVKFWSVKLISADDLKESKMILIRSGDFYMGSQEGEGRPDEHPRHKVYLDSFYIDRFEVTGQDFEN